VRTTNRRYIRSPAPLDHTTDLRHPRGPFTPFLSGKHCWIAPELDPAAIVPHLPQTPQEHRINSDGFRESSLQNLPPQTAGAGARDSRPRENPALQHGSWRQPRHLLLIVKGAVAAGWRIGNCCCRGPDFVGQPRPRSEPEGVPRVRMLRLASPHPNTRLAVRRRPCGRPPRVWTGLVPTNVEELRLPVDKQMRPRREDHAACCFQGRVVVAVPATDCVAQDVPLGHRFRRRMRSREPADSPTCSSPEAGTRR
jgi:hypothetical protein